MPEAAVSLLASWASFCTIIGSSAAALTGLMFVAITLIASSERLNRSGDSLAAFGTPTVVHFCSALLVAVTLSAPWPALWQAALLLGLAGLVGVIYVGVIFRRTRHQTSYEPVLEDWLWHIGLPLLSYLGLVVSALLLPVDPVPTLFVIAAVTVLLLFIGLHNAWDTVTYIIIQEQQPPQTHKNEQAQ